MRSRCAARHAGQRDGLTARHCLTRPDADLAQMAVHRDQTLSVIDKDRVAIKKIVARVDYGAGGSGADWRSRVHGDIEAGVRISRLTVK